MKKIIWHVLAENTDKVGVSRLRTSHQLQTEIKTTILSPGRIEEICSYIVSLTESSLWLFSDILYKVS